MPPIPKIVKRASEQTLPKCKACGGSGVSSKGFECIPCDGKGVQRASNSGAMQAVSATTQGESLQSSRRQEVR